MHPHHDRESLIAAIQGGERPTYLFFWGHTAPAAGGPGKHFLSQWWPAPFQVGGVTYRSAENFMMAEKARLFGDEEAAARVLAAPTPAAAKKVGREVRGFNEERWAAARFEIVVRGSVGKFGGNAELRAYLLDTGDRVLVEASPRDRIWGIGVGESNPRAADPAQWPGLNLLGFALMEARRRLAG